MKNIIAPILRGRRLAFVLLAGNVLLLTLYLTGWSSGALGQLGPRNKKKVEKHKTYLKLPIEIFEPKIRDTPIALGEQFDGDNDWLKGLRFKIRNTSEKPIIWVSIF